MAKTITSFNGGLFSSYLRGRIELEKYSSALQDVENYHILKYGALQNRAGTIFQENINHDADCRIITFQYNVKQSYVLVFSNSILRIVKDGAYLGIPDLITNYTAEQVHNIQYIQVADVMYFVHPDVPVYKLVRKGELDWEFSVVQELQEAPFLEYNNSDTSLTPSATSGTNITVTASDDLFEADHIGRTILFKQTRTHNKTQAINEWLPVNGTWNFATQGNWNGEVIIEKTTDDGVTTQTYRHYGSSYVANNTAGTNYNVDGKEESPNAMLRISQIPSGCTATLSVNDNFTYGKVKITGYTSPTEITGDVIEPLDNTQATKEWAYNAFSHATGYPTAIELHDNRLVLGGTYSQPSTVFMSKLDEWDNFTPDEGALAPIVLKLNTSETIQWIRNERDGFVVGTSGSEKKVQQKTPDKPLSGDNIKVSNEGAEGSINLQAINVSDVNIFVARDGMRVRAMSYNFEADKLVSNDLCSLSGTEFLESGIKEFTYKQNPTGEIYFVLGNGKVAVLTYDKEQNVFAWTIFATQGEILSVCSVKNVDNDYLYLAVRRNGSLFLEKMLDRDFVDKEHWHFLDGGYFLEYETPTDTITGLDALEGQEVSIVVDGNIINDDTVVNGELTLPYAGKFVSVGYPYMSYAQIMDIDNFGQGQSNVPQKKKFNKIYVKVRESVGLYAGASLDKLEFVKIHSTSGVWLNNIQEVVSDIVTINIDSNHTEEYAPYLAQKLPFAQEILGIASTVSIGG